MTDRSNAPTTGRYVVYIKALVEVEAIDEWHASDKVRDLLVADGVRYQVLKIQSVKWEGDDAKDN